MNTIPAMSTIFGAPAPTVVRASRPTIIRALAPVIGRSIVPIIHRAAWTTVVRTWAPPISWTGGSPIIPSSWTVTLFIIIPQSILNRHHPVQYLTASGMKPEMHLYIHRVNKIRNMRIYQKISKSHH